MFSVLRFPSKTPSGVPISDPFAEVKVLKTFARLGVYGAILIFCPIDIYLIGFSIAETAYIQTAYVGVSTAAIELTFKQSLKLRKRSAYPARMLVEIGSLSSVPEAVDGCLSVFQNLIPSRAGVLVAAWTADGLQPISRLGCQRDDVERLMEAYGSELRGALESQTPLLLEPRLSLVASGAIRDRETVVIIPIVAFTRSIGLLLAAGDAKSHDLKDIELLRGIGNAIGLSIENIRQREAIEEKERRLRTVVTAAPIVLLNTDGSGVLTLLEGRGLERLEVNPADLLGRSVFEVFRDFDGLGRQFQRALAGEVVTARARIRDITFEAELNPVRDASSEVIGVIAVATDITERIHAEETIRHMAYHDSLTGLPNRELFEDRLAERIAESRATGTQLAALFIDLDGFKTVNDTIGHAEGDRLLKNVAQQLAGLIREDDLVARVGGDEFLVLLPHVSGTEEAEAVSGRVLSGLRRDWVVGSHRFRISASVGIALFPRDAEDVDSLIRAADRAMYEAKDNGRDRYALAVTA